MDWQYHLAEWRADLNDGVEEWRPDIPIRVPFSCIDLRPKGFGPGLTLVATPRGVIGFKGTADKFGEDPLDTIPPGVARALGNRLGLTLAGSTVRDVLIELLTVHADDADAGKWNRIRPTSGLFEAVRKGGRIKRARPTHEIYLGGLVAQWRDPALEFDFTHGTVKEEDLFGLASNVDIGGTNPDTTNASSNAWDDNGANTVQGTGSGAVDFSANEDFASIDTTFVDGKAVGEYDPSSQTNNDMIITGRSDNVSDTIANNDQYFYKLDNQFNDCEISKWVSGSYSNIDWTTLSVSNGSDYSIALQCNGTTIKGFAETPVTDSPTERLSATDTSINGTTVGGTFWGFSARKRTTNVKLLRWFFDDLVVPTVYEDALTLGVSQGLTVAAATTIEGALSLGVSQGMTQAMLGAYEGQAALGLSQGLAEAGDQIVEGQAALGLSQGVADAADTTVEGQVPLGLSQGVTNAPLAIYEGAAAFGLSQGVTAAAAVTAEAALNFAINQSLATSGGLVFADGVALGLQASMANLGGLVLEDAIALALQNAVAAANDIDFFTALSLGLSQGITADSTLVFEGAITLAADAGADAGAATVFDVAVTLSAQQTIANAAGVSIEASVTLAAQVAAAITGVLTGAAPGFRTIIVASDGRTGTPGADSRAITVRRDNRTIIISGD